MHWHGWFTLAVVAAMLVGLLRYAHVADVIFLGGLTLLVCAGVITADEALIGFSNSGVLTIAALFVVAAALVETGFLEQLTRRILGTVSTSEAALRRIVSPVVVSSAFLNNTTIVAMMLPALLDWCRKRRIAPSRLLLPLSYASILGGVCTLIGTSTNLLVHGLMQQSGDPRLSAGLGMWEIGKIGVPIALVGAIYLIIVAPRLLPDRKEFLEQVGDNRREYLLEIIVESHCPLIGQTVQQAGLRGLPGLFLIEIDREGQVLSPVGPSETLRAADRLIFTGIVSTIVDLQKTPGLVPAADATYQLSADDRLRRRLCEAVISPSSPLVGQNIREANFRGTYDAVVVAVHRNGKRLQQKIGDIRLEPGDTLLLQSGPHFVNAHRNNPDFFLVSEIDGVRPVRHERAWIAAAIAGAMVIFMSLPDMLNLVGVSGEWVKALGKQRVTAAILAAGLMVMTRCLSSKAARRSINLDVIVVVASAIGIGTAMTSSGMAKIIADQAVFIIDRLGFGPMGLLAGIFLLTWVATEIMSNAAAAAIMFPIAVKAASSIDADPRAMVIALTLGASAGFLLPAGYQTHLMVFGPGGYKIGDFVKIGLPMVAIWFGMVLLLLPFFWPV